MSIRDTFIRSLRARELASDERAGSWARDRTWRVQRNFIVDRWVLLLALWLVMVSPVPVLWWFLPTFFQGALLGAVLVGASLVVWTWVVHSTGTSPAMMGTHAEQRTAQELRRLGQGWRLVNHFVLSMGDVDHVVVGPAGVFVIETKWSAQPWLEAAGSTRVAAACDQVQRAARQVRMWKPVKDSGMPVHSVVVLWGGDLQRETTDTVTRYSANEVKVLAGRALTKWMRTHQILAFDAEVVDTVWQALQEQVRRREKHDLELVTPVLSPSQLAARVAWFATLATLGFLAVAECAVLVDGAGWGIGCGVALTCFGLSARRKLDTRVSAGATGLALGAALPTAVLLVAAATS